MKKILFAFFLLAPVFATAQIITTIAGNGLSASTGDGGPATAASIGTASFCAFDSAGNFYFGEYPGRVRMISTAGIITTVIGGPIGAFGGDGGPATAAEIDVPAGVAFDNSGNLYVADANNHRIRQVNAKTGIITTVVGSGSPGYTGDGGPATAASIWSPASMAFDAAGNMYFDDLSTYIIRKVNPSGIIDAYAGDNNPGYAGNGGPASAATFNGLDGLRIDNEGNLLSAEEYEVRKINLAANIVTTPVGTGIAGNSGDGGPATAALMTGTEDVAPDSWGDFFFSDNSNNVIRMVDAEGIVHHIAGNPNPGYNPGFTGDGGPATAADLNNQRGIALAPNGDLYILDNGNYRIRKIAFALCKHSDEVTTPTVNPSLSIFPNPTQNTLTIQSPDQITEITITNLLGQQVFTNQYSTQQAEVNVSALPPGIYFIKINGTEVRKFVKA